MFYCSVFHWFLSNFICQHFFMPSNFPWWHLSRQWRLLGRVHLSNLTVIELHSTWYWVTMLQVLIDWLIVMACQPVQSYFMLRDSEMAFILGSYLYFFVLFFKIFFVLLNRNNWSWVTELIRYFIIFNKAWKWMAGLPIQGFSLIYFSAVCYTRAQIFQV